MEASTRQAAWDAAGAGAVADVRDGMRLGLGTGRSAAAAIEALAARVRDGLRCVGVPTSKASATLARQRGIPIGRPGGRLDLAFDGADAVTPDGLIVKGAGGAMVRERIVAASADRFLVLVDETKLMDSLDGWGRLPIAVVPFAAPTITRILGDLRPVARPARSDDGLVLIDLHPETGADWVAVAERARAVPGVVDHGLFRASPADVLVGFPDGARSMVDLRA